jgi:SAM-dependent methyltransferase
MIRMLERMSEHSLIIDLHRGNRRLGPGSDVQTRRAIEMAGLTADAHLSVADLGCGTGASALLLARCLGARVTAVDSSAELLDELRERASREGLEASLRPVVADIADLPLKDAEFDLIWSEAAIYNVGFAQGVRAWRRFLKPGGVVAVSDLVWTTATRPPEIDAHWSSAYPTIGTASDRIATLERSGYQPVGHFLLPHACWHENYYTPLRDSFAAFLDRHARSPEAQALVDAEEHEAQLHERFGDRYGYAFFIARRVED